MNNKIKSSLFIIAVVFFIFIVVSNFIFKETIPEEIFFILCFFSSCLMLPRTLQDVKTEENPTPTDWTRLITNIIAVILTFVCFLFCLIRNE